MSNRSLDTIISFEWRKQSLPAFSFFRRLTVRYGSNERLTYRVFMPEFIPREWKSRKKTSFFLSFFLSFFPFFFEKISSSRIIYLHCTRGWNKISMKNFGRFSIRVLKTVVGRIKRHKMLPPSPFLSSPSSPIPNRYENWPARRSSSCRFATRVSACAHTSAGETKKRAGQRARREELQRN